MISIIDSMSGSKVNSKYISWRLFSGAKNESAKDRKQNQSKVNYYNESKTVQFFRFLYDETLEI